MFKCITAPHLKLITCWHPLVSLIEFCGNKFICLEMKFSLGCKNSCLPVSLSVRTIFPK